MSGVDALSFIGVGMSRRSLKVPRESKYVERYPLFSITALGAPDTHPGGWRLQILRFSSGWNGGARTVSGTCENPWEQLNSSRGVERSREVPPFRCLAWGRLRALCTPETGNGSNSRPSDERHFAAPAQGYLAHKDTPTPLGPP